MAPRGPMKARDYDYSNVGKAGRRTGLTLEEAKRDEYGMEDIEGMWSSPEKSPVKENGFHGGDDDSTGSDGMSMDEGTGPGPADFLSSVNSRRSSFFPPPVARSPMKTGLTGSPRRTPGPRSSQSPQPDFPSSSPSDGKGLGIVNGESRHEVSPLTNRSINAPTLSHARAKVAGKPVEPAPTASFSDSDANGDENGNDYMDNFAAGEETTLGDQIEDQENAGDSSVLVPNAREKEQRKPAPKAKKDAGEKARTKPVAESIETENQEQPAKRKRGGRPPKSQTMPSAGEGSEARPAKKAKTSSKPAREDAPDHPELEKVVENYANRTGPLKGRSLYILKRETPTDSSTTHTRSGRVSVRPLAYWRNERCVYGDGEAAEGQRYPLSTIKEVIRTEELPTEKRQGNKRRSKKSKSKKDDDSDSDEEYVDPWEKEGGVLHGYIRKWDSENQTGTEEEEVLDIAYAPSGIETRAVKGSSFRFAKLLSSPFLGSGIVELPPSGVKKPKNSKRMHMIFYVCQGRVQVDISGVQFSAGKGCVFQVPRGNYYSFANNFSKDARLFFTQGCVPTENDGSVPGSATKPDMMEGEESSEPPKAARTGGAKGRPKGKQKAGSKSS
ncbi:kinetochore CENP-C fungal-like protein [Aspergillus ambiguus]|uniref:Cupin domain protein n=1 Tax=Aspergillus ambiguus TaxID=176160 RepID=UPI003CCDB286